MYVGDTDIFSEEISPWFSSVGSGHFVWRVSLGKEENRELYALDPHIAALGGETPLMPWFEYRKRYCKKITTMSRLGDYSKYLMVEFAMALEGLPSPSNNDQSWIRNMAGGVMCESHRKCSAIYLSL